MSLLPPDPCFILRSDMNYVHSICFLDKENDFSRTLLAATESGFVYFWDLDRNKVKTKHQMGESIQKIHSISNNKILTQEKKGTVKIWSPTESSYENTGSYNFYGGFCRSIIVDDKILLPQEKGTVEILNLDNLQPILKLKSEEETSEAPTCLEKVTINNKIYILVGYASGKVVLYDFNQGKQCNKIQLKGNLISMTYDDYTRRAVCGNDTNMLQLFQLGNNLEMSVKCEVCITNNGCNVVKLRPDKKIFISGGWDNRIRVHSWKTLRVLVVLTPHRKPITDVEFSPSIVEQYGDKIMACSSADGGISLWNIYN